jgi:hypothetical protein
MRYLASGRWSQTELGPAMIHEIYQDGRFAKTRGAERNYPILIAPEFSCI